MLALIIEP